MLKKRVQNGNNSNNKVKLGRRTKFLEFFVHYIIYREKCVLKKGIKVKKIEMLFVKK
jgi:hypothetical protein